MKVIHLKVKVSKDDFYFSSLAAMFESGISLGVSIHTLYKEDLKKGFENDTIVIKQGLLIGKKRESKQ
jgi:hypothetical protein